MTDDALSIRPATADDAPALSVLLAELDHPTTAEEVAARLPLVTGPALVAVRGGRVVGLVTTSVMTVLHRPTPVGRLSALVVTRTGHGHGVGRALVARAEELLAARGCGLVEVTSNFRFEPAHAFYRHLGYEATSLRFKRDLDAPPSP